MIDNTKDWKYRFANFQWTLEQLERTIANKKLSGHLRTEIILFFEVSLELSIKTLKSYLLETGINPVSTNEVIKCGASLGIFDDIDMWLEAVEKKISSDSVYDEKQMPQIEASIREYYKMLKKFSDSFEIKFCQLNQISKSID